MLDKLRGSFPATFAAGKSAFQGVLEGFTKVAIEVSINQGIQGAVEVPNPKKDGDHCFRKIARVGTKRGCQVPGTRKNDKLLTMSYC